MSDEVTVDLRSAITDKGTAYGPGVGISIPREVAVAHGLVAVEQQEEHHEATPAKAEKKNGARGK